MDTDTQNNGVGEIALAERGEIKPRNLLQTTLQDNRGTKLAKRYFQTVIHDGGEKKIEVPSPESPNEFMAWKHFVFLRYAFPSKTYNHTFDTNHTVVRGDLREGYNQEDQLEFFYPRLDKGNIAMEVLSGDRGSTVPVLLYGGRPNLEYHGSSDFFDVNFITMDSMVQRYHLFDYANKMRIHESEQGIHLAVDVPGTELATTYYSGALDEISNQHVLSDLASLMQAGKGPLAGSMFTAHVNGHGRIVDLEKLTQ